MARTPEELQTDITRIEEIMVDANVTGNPDTMNVLDMVHQALLDAVVPIKESTATRLASFDAADTELVGYSNEARVSTELKTTLLDAREYLARRRENV